LLKSDFGVAADVWSAPSFTLLRRDGLETARWNMLHPSDAPRSAFVARQLEGYEGPLVASTDYMKTYADQIRPFVDRRFSVLGTDGFGRSDTRAQLRSHFEVDRRWVAVAALKALADEGTLGADKVAEAIKKYEIDPAKPSPVTV
jgi:pyruvate dehydrogenase E1 component